MDTLLSKTKLSKVELRKLALEKRKILEKNGTNAINSSNIVSKILNSKDFVSAKNVAIYYPVKNEINLLNLLKVEGKNFYFPRCKGLELEFVKYENNNLTLGAYEIMEPTGLAVKPEILDVIYVPCLMANKKNFRLGYGKGYYDRFFSKNKETLKAKKIIVAAKELISDSFREDSFDIPCDDTIC